jgi:hypothetical protein
MHKRARASNQGEDYQRGPKVQTKRSLSDRAGIAIRQVLNIAPTCRRKSWGILWLPFWQKTRNTHKPDIASAPLAAIGWRNAIQRSYTAAVRSVETDCQSARALLAASIRKNEAATVPDE